MNDIILNVHNFLGKMLSGMSLHVFIINPLNRWSQLWSFFKSVLLAIKSLLLGMKWVFKYQDLQMFGVKQNKYE